MDRAPPPPPTSRSRGRPLEQIIVSRPRELGGIAIRRVLPSPYRRAVGSFVFLDEMGPTDFLAGQGVDVPPHPHIHLATLTYLFEGRLLHRDSVGSATIIQPGAVNWMSAGRGIVHSERTPPDARAHPERLHGLQFWLALPQDHEDSDPFFVHHEASTLPVVAKPGLRARVLAGRYEGVASPLSTFSDVLLVDVVLESDARFYCPRIAAEQALYVAEGALDIGPHTLERGQLGLLDTDPGTPWIARGPTRVILLGGAPLDAPRHMWWNFISSDPQRIEQAAAAWRDHRFPLVPGDETEFMPLPER